jgi:hypothetical protein
VHTDAWTAAPAPPAPPWRLDAADGITTDQVHAMLSAPSLSGLLNLLGFGAEDAEDAHVLVEGALTDRRVLGAVARAASALRSRAGLTCPRADLDRLPAEDEALLRDRGIGAPAALPLLAALVGTATVREFHRRRGLSRDASWEALSDLGSQVAVHRRVTGDFGLDALDWVALTWVGRLYRVGTLQIGLEPLDAPEDGAGPAAGRGTAPTHRISLHVPRGASLSPTSVDESLAAARDLLDRSFGDVVLAPEWVCDSWLLDPRLAEILPEDSRLLGFQRRFDVVDAGDGTDEMCFFVFDRPRGTPLTAGDIPTLPRDTSLRRGIANLLSTGERWRSGHGVLRVAP